ncbi:Lipocalin-related protein and Bos/Can/Equ allergen [Roseibacterium elongatum DSM 19469]|uniref:Lipocalin-related protein and Bos/Can/Equ allergen n=1 Tax=Roseicyclus elongatus DSM 19469 TaxID=1294273 RepID=W8RTN4_9RHOB|nr:YeeE/YedE family protein [Roseibacterium elongatum]AHM04579.1 Lipocalin-related protein and Bos/Can/Equ allergen [Roseibacterium elongatum DSM 19469]
MLDILGETGAILLIGLVGGIVLGLAARLGRFCTLAMIEDAHYGNDLSRLWLWVMALGTALAANFALDAAGLMEISQSFYITNAFPVLGAVLGGLMFGYGMAQAGNCGFGHLARIGGGDLRSLVIVLAMGVTAMVTISGLLAALRIRLFPVTFSPDRPQGLAHAAERITGIDASLIGMALGVVMILAAIRFLPTERRASHLFWGGLVGLTVTSGFFGTWWVANTGFGAWPVVSHAFTAPVGDTIHYAMFSSGLDPKFGIASVVGVIIGGGIGSVIRFGLHWEACDDPRQLKRQLAGAGLMGVGAVLAAGCSVGQGLSGFSVLGYTAPLTAAAIWAGAWLGLRQLIVGFAAQH